MPLRQTRGEKDGENFEKSIYAEIVFRDFQKVLHSLFFLLYYFALQGNITS